MDWQGEASVGEEAAVLDGRYTLVMLALAYYLYQQCNMQ